LVSSRRQTRIIDEFTRWATAQGIVPEGQAGQRWHDRITILLQGRSENLDRPDPTRWRSGDVHDLLMNHVVSRQVDAWDLADHGLDTIRDFLRFLDATELLHPASTRVPTLLKELDRLAPKYPAAMADTSRWRLAKRVLTAALADGLTMDSEPAAFDAWAEAFSARDPEGRRAVLGELMGEHPGYATERFLIHEGKVAVLAPDRPVTKHMVWPDLACDCGCDQSVRYPPVAIPDLGVLAEQVATTGATLLQHLATLAGWVGAHGQAVDDHGELRRADRAHLLAHLGLPTGPGAPTDVPALTRLWQLALEFDVIQVRRTRVVLGAGTNLVTDVLAGTAAPEQALELWSDLADAIVHPPVPARATKDGGSVREWLRPWTPRFLGLLYAASTQTSGFDDLVDQMLTEYAHDVPPDDGDLLAGVAATVVRQTMAELTGHGAVEVSGVDADPDPRDVAAAAALGTTAWALRPQPDLVVGLTDLGRHLVRRHLLTEGAEAPLSV
jgi:hypothetical protein